MKRTLTVLLSLYCLTVQAAPATNDASASSVPNYPQRDMIKLRALAEQGDAAAMQWFRKSAERGNAEAEYHLGTCYALGLGTATNQEEATEWYRQSAGRGNARAQYLLGLRYRDGTGISQSYPSALKWLLLAQARGEMDATGVVAQVEQQLSLEEREEVARNVRRWKPDSPWLPRDISKLRKQADGGDVKAQLELGQAYLYGFGIAKDEDAGRQFVEQAAERGDPRAQHELSRCYEKGIGVAASEGESVYWLRSAASAGDALSQTFLGERLYHGAGGITNEAQAYVWLSRASAQGDVLGQRYLGELLLGRKQYLEAYRWLVLADRHGQIELEPLIDQCTRNLTPEQIAEAQRWSREFVPVVEWKGNVFNKR